LGFPTPRDLSRGMLRNSRKEPWERGNKKFLVPKGTSQKPPKPSLILQKKIPNCPRKKFPRELPRGKELKEGSPLEKLVD